MRSSSIAVIILNYNTSDDCRTCISFLNSQTGVEIQIIVVDNCSQKGEVEKLSAYCLAQEIVFLQCDQNKGYSAGNNIGLRYAAQNGMKYAMIVNPDMELHQTDYIQKLSKTMDSDSGIAILGSDIVLPQGQHQNPRRDEGDYWGELFLFWEVITKKSYIGDYTRSGFCNKLSGCCFMIRMSFVEQIGFLDENTFLYCEEPILSKQVQRAGMKMYYCTENQVVHNHVKSAKGDPVKRMKVLAESRNYYLKTYSDYSPLAVALLRLSRQINTLLFASFHKIKMLLKKE